MATVNFHLVVHRSHRKKLQAIK